MNIKAVTETTELPATFQLTCTRCAHKWLRRTLTRPQACPRCKVKRWDIPSRRQRQNQEVTAQ